MGGANHTFRERECMCVFRQECIDGTEKRVAIVLGGGCGLGGQGYQ